jgi:hypothetical protein
MLSLKEKKNLETPPCPASPWCRLSRGSHRSRQSYWRSTTPRALMRPRWAKRATSVWCTRTQVRRRGDTHQTVDDDVSFKRRLDNFTMVVVCKRDSLLIREPPKQPSAKPVLPWRSRRLAAQSVCANHATYGLYQGSISAISVGGGDL